MALPTNTLSMSQVNEELNRNSTNPISFSEINVRKMALSEEGPVQMFSMLGGSAFTVATGGSVAIAVINDIRYKVHSFLSPGTNMFSVLAAGRIVATNIEYFIVAGGGPGGGAVNANTARSGWRRSGGGEVLQGSIVTKEEDYDVTVADRSLSGSWNATLSIGQSSSFSNFTETISAIGGQASRGLRCCPDQSGPLTTGGVRTSSVTTNFDGVNKTYSVNGQSRSLGAGPVDGPPNSGNGGSARWVSGSGRGGHGGTGVVILRYEEPETLN